ncbi:hypothetical protein T08_7664 [Trichinella sp. T8]|nr:hypothetical protein T08_9061 [Trichinella sp. T8]KRZ94966.1 hypothetical protein T08_7664 [Trichinella sp. T8]
MQVLCSWFRLLFYKKEIMVCNDTGLIVRYIPFSSVTLTSASKQKATPADKLQATPSGMPQATLPGMPQATLPGMPQATLPGMPQATLPGYASRYASGYASRLSLRLRRGLRLRLYFFLISKIFNFSNNLPQATPPASPQAIFEKISPLGHAFGNFQKNIYLVATPQAIFQKNICL